jgi:hypothetical protein
VPQQIYTFLEKIDLIPEGEEENNVSFIVYDALQAIFKSRNLKGNNAKEDFDF